MSIRPARPHDAHLLPAIERSAAEAFLAVERLAWVAAHEVLSVEEHLGFIDKGLLWVAVDEQDQPLGFLCASVQDGGVHIDELSVALCHQGQGLGRALIACVEAWAQAQGFTALTLTTFREVPWNAPFYARLGFVCLDNGELQGFLRQQIAHEHALGLPGRCAMRKALPVPA
ncbi:GNAT family N-acetyltransferase [Pseudomonas sp. 5P_5.1_Bac1]|uniref:GNAT family N-acetyltransferase n=1 Tax=Pseudomonas sp. 5P_5.1_Bac1 TaxID=2971616 RepID=UPI0021CAC81D|nr:GNAT family N-acetyltransferase [Pseudomonas sp. 5P_5.1_Bac1]MCU1724160.1 GNAT family N-acetyltransferase [Pseudomonas sp. 5P_5.1_Bac1]